MASSAFHAMQPRSVQCRMRPGAVRPQLYHPPGSRASGPGHGISTAGAPHSCGKRYFRSRITAAQAFSGSGISSHRGRRAAAQSAAARSFRLCGGHWAAGPACPADPFKQASRTPDVPMQLAAEGACSSLAVQGAQSPVLSTAGSRPRIPLPGRGILSAHENVPTQTVESRP